MTDTKLGVPDDLLKELHAANTKFHEAGEHLKEANKGVEYRHEERVITATKEVHQAEQKVEEIEDQITEVMKSVKV